MILQDGVVILLTTIQNKFRHQDYDRVKKVAKDFTMYRTGVGIKEKLIRFSGGQTVEMFDQMVQIAIVNTPDIFNSCIKPLYKVGRAPATKVFNWTGTDQEKNIIKRKQLLDYAKTFWGEKSVDSYLTKKTVDYDGCDPNAFLVIDFEEGDTKAEARNPYPVEVSSEAAINFMYDNNILEFLTVLNDKVTMTGDEGKQIPAEIYYQYLDKEAITATEIYRKSVPAYLQLNSGVIQIEGPLPTIDPLKTYLWNFGKDENDKRYFELKISQHKIGFVPAKRFGTETDASTEHRTCVPVVNPAQSYFEDSIQTMSEFGVTKKFHAFPQKWQYANKCGAHDCHKGYLLDGKTICGKCKGTGTEIHTTASDIITLPMPDELKDIINIDLLSTYKTPSIDLIKFQKEYGFDDLRTYAINAVYGGDAYGRQKSLKTATEVETDIDSVYDAVKAYGDNWSEFYVFIYKCIAIVRGLGDGFECIHIFPSDLKMQSLDSLLNDLTLAGSSGAPSHIKKSITKKITHKVYADDPREILKIETKDKYYPFPGKTETEIAFIIANGKTTKKLETLYAHFDLIISDIEYEQSLDEVDFYNLPEIEQRALIEEKLQEYVLELENQDAAAAAQSFAVNNNMPPDVLSGLNTFKPGDKVTVIPGKEKDPTHAEVNYIVDSIKGTNVNIKDPLADPSADIIIYPYNWLQGY